MTNNDSQYGLARLVTGVPGFDQILKGGLHKGAVYILRGTPGAGKTIVANQMCFHHAREGGKALFVTLLAENHARMLQHLEQMTFFDARLIPKQVYYVSAFRVLEENGLKGLMELLRREIRAHNASLLVLDGLIAVEESSGSDREFRKFIHELQAHASVADCCTLLLTNGRRGEYHPEHTMVDGLITLDDVVYGKRRQRELEVRKFRGSASLRGRHSFRITDDGLVVFPRCESQFLRTQEVASRDRMSSGVRALDIMLGGGYVRSSSTLLLGASGSGKTTLGLHFLAQASKSQPALHFGFYESAATLVANAQLLGVDLATPLGNKHLQVIWSPPVEGILDSLGNQLIDAVRSRQVRRLFIDGWGAFAAAADLPERLGPFFAAVLNELRSLDVTVVCAAETENVVGPEIRVPTQGISAISENLILLRYSEYKSRLRRLISIMKVRGGAFDPTVREFQISSNGLAFTDSFDGAEQLLTGFATQSAVRRKAVKSNVRRAKKGGRS